MPDISYSPREKLFLKIAAGLMLLLVVIGLCLLLVSMPSVLSIDLTDRNVADMNPYLALLVLSVLGWKAATRYHFFDRNTPLSTIRSAAQGYVKLRGKGRPLADEIVRPPTPCYCWPCLWYRLTEEKRGQSNEWHVSHREQSKTPFMLIDATGECLVDTETSFFIYSNHSETFSLDPHTRITLETLNYDDDIYVIGDFRTISCSESSLDADRDTRALLAKWEQNPQLMRQLLKLEGHGPFSEREQALSQQAARFEVRRRHKKLRENPAIHTMSKPQTKRPFIVSNIHLTAQDQARNRWISNGFFGLLFLVALVGILAALGLTVGGVRLME